MNTLTIVRVLSIVDTREYIEEGDRWVPVPGSGEQHECHRCGRIHEVHAHVVLSDGSEAVVGTGCAKGESAEIVRALTNGANAAKRTRILEREVEKARSLVAAWEAKSAEFDALPFPEIREEYRKASAEHEAWGRRGTLVLRAGGQEVWCGDYLSLSAMPRSDREERLSCLRESMRFHYCGNRSNPGVQLRYAEDALAKHKKRLALKESAK